MSKSVMLSLLAQGNTGSELLSILDALVDDNLHLVDGRHRTEALSSFDYIESPMIEQVLGIPTREEVAF